MRSRRARIVISSIGIVIALGYTVWAFTTYRNGLALFWAALLLLQVLGLVGAIRNRPLRELTVARFRTIALGLGIVALAALGLGIGFTVLALTEREPLPRALLAAGSLLVAAACVPGLVRCRGVLRTGEIPDKIRRRWEEAQRFRIVP